MPFSTSTKKMNMLLQTNSPPIYYSNMSVSSVRPVTSTTTSGVLNGVGGARRVFNQGSMIDKISNTKNSGCGSCGGK